MYTTSHGLSIRVMWLFCTGMRLGDDVRQAEYELERLLRLGSDSIRTSADIDAVNSILDECSRHLPGACVLQIRHQLEAEHPFFSNTKPAREAA